MNMNKKYYTIPEASKYLGISKQRLYLAKNSRKIHAELKLIGTRELYVIDAALIEKMKEQLKEMEKT